MMSIFNVPFQQRQFSYSAENWYHNGRIAARLAAGGDFDQGEPGEEFEPAWGDEPDLTPDAFTPVETEAND